MVTEVALSKYDALLSLVSYTTDTKKDQYGGHFGLNRGTVENAAQRVQNGARNVLEKN